MKSGFPITSTSSQKIFKPSNDNFAKSVRLDSSGEKPKIVLRGGVS